MDFSDLHDYQHVSIKHIIDNPFCALFLDMGLGKTVSTLTAIDHLMYTELEVLCTLVIAPKRVVENVWAQEVKKWTHLSRLKVVRIIGTQKQRISAIKEKADIHVISRDNFAWLCAYYGYGRMKWDTFVFDELSSFKSHSSIRFKAAKKVRPFMKRVIGLTGTPAPNSLIDLWPQVYLLDMGHRLGKTITKYRKDFFTPGHSSGHIVYSYNIVSNGERLIHDKVKDICISMKAEDYLTMPDKIENFIELEFDSKLKKTYKEFERENVLQMFDSAQKKQYEDDDGNIVESDEVIITAVNAAALTNKLLQFSNGAIYDEDRNVHKVHDLKLDALAEILDDANGQSVLVAWNYRHDRSRILERFAKYSPIELKTEQDINDWNDGKVKLAISHPASVGHGLNLQAGGNIIVWFGLNWSLELYQQFNARLYRQGQNNAVVINHIIIKGTHDEAVVKAIKKKGRIQGSLMEAVKALREMYIDTIK